MRSAPWQTELRFGNPAYRDWFAAMLQDALLAMQRVLPESMQVGRVATPSDLLLNMSHPPMVTCAWR